MNPIALRSTGPGLALAALVALLAIACDSDSSGTNASGETGVESGETGDDGFTVPSGGTPSLDADVSGPEPDTDNGEGGDTPEGEDAPEPEWECPEEEFSVPCEPEDGEFGWPCEENADCNSGFCIETAAGFVCADPCVENCPPNWVCSEVGGAGQDTVFICKPRFPRLCDPCVDATDCSDGGVAGSTLCIDFGIQGRFCGGSCSEDVPCPGGYTCTEVDNPTGPPAMQCIPDSGECSCSPSAQEKTLSTVCAVTNGFGTCAGLRFCTEDGLSDCDADVPDIDVCDGVDNNCDGQTDNNASLEECDIPNEFGTCTGVVECSGGVATCIGEVAGNEICDGMDNDCDGQTDEEDPDTDNDGLADCLDLDDDDDDIDDTADNCPLTSNTDQANFDGDAEGDACDNDDDNDNVPDTMDCAPLDQAVYPGATEICDGKDNDCQNGIDDGICFDGNPCTSDICDAESGCVYEPYAGPCDDSNICTVGDKCIGGTCTGDALNCDDGNPCTDDFCGPATGCTNPNANGKNCEDGNKCTEGDACQNGSCNSGFSKNCDDGNPCTLDTCNPSSGCNFNASAVNNQPCDDDDPCTTLSQCSGGSCATVQSYVCPPNPMCFLQTCLGIGDLPLCICI